jgi:hypothetical protein
MWLPNFDRAHVDRRKLTEYLLNRNHPGAKGKSAFFCGRYGGDWERLRDDLLERVVLLNQHGVYSRVQKVLTFVALSLTESPSDDS